MKFFFSFAGHTEVIHEIASCGEEVHIYIPFFQTDDIDMFAKQSSLWSDGVLGG